MEVSASPLKKDSGKGLAIVEGFHCFLIAVAIGLSSVANYTQGSNVIPNKDHLFECLRH